MSATNFDDPRIDEGIRLFNEGEYFACHDVLEDFWTELISEEKSMFQGLIQAAVALFHFEEGNLGGARRMYFSSRAYLSGFRRIVGGIDIPALIDGMDLCFAELSAPHTSYPSHVTLQPSLIPRIQRERKAESGRFSGGGPIG